MLNPSSLFQSRSGFAAVPDLFCSTSSSAVRGVVIFAAFLAFSISAFAQVETIPIFTVTSNDVAQSSIMVFRTRGTNETRVSIKFAFTDTGAKRLEEFYRTHSVGEEVRW